MDKPGIALLKIYDNIQKYVSIDNNVDFMDENCLDALITTGNKTAHVLILVNHDIYDLNSDESILMKKILEAVGLSSEKVFIISKPTLNVNVLWRYFNINRCLLFGINAAKMGLHITMNKYELVSFKNKILLLSDAVEDLQKHPENKKLLWKALQSMFK